MIFAVQLGSVESHRHPDIELAAGTEEREAARKNANNGERFLVEQNVPANDTGIAAEPALPQSVGDDRHLVMTGLIFFGDEGATEHWLDAKQTKEICRSVDAEDLFGLARTGEVVKPGAPGGKLFERMILVSPVKEFSG
jgi:hypothetical protein